MSDIAAQADNDAPPDSVNSAVGDKEARDERNVRLLRLIVVTASVLLLVWWAKDFRWELVWANRALLIRGLGWTLTFFIGSMVFGMLAGIVLAAARAYGPRPVRMASTALIETVRGTPQLMVIFWVYFTIPEVLGSAPSSELAALSAMSAIAAAYLAEDVRAGFRSVPQIQWESGTSTGLRPSQTFILIVLPQALRNMIPALLATGITMVKVTSLTYVVGAIDLFRAMILINNRIYEPYALYLVIALFYFIFCYLMTRLIHRIDPKYSIRS